MTGINVIKLVENRIYLEMLKAVERDKAPKITFHIFEWVVDFYESRNSTIIAKEKEVNVLKVRAEMKRGKLVRLNESINELSDSIRRTKRKVRKVVKMLGKSKSNARSEALEEQQAELLKQKNLDTQQLAKLRQRVERIERKYGKAVRLVQDVEADSLKLAQERDELYEIIADIAKLVPLPACNRVLVVRKTGIRALALLNDLRGSQLEAEIGKSIRNPFQAAAVADFAQVCGLECFGMLPGAVVLQF